MGFKFETLEALEKEIEKAVREAIKSLNALVQGSVGGKNGGISRAERLAKLDVAIPAVESFADRLTRHLQAIHDAVDRASEGKSRLYLASQVIRSPLAESQ